PASRKSKHGHMRSLQWWWAVALKRAQVRKIRVHDLRHTYASVGAAAGLSLPVIGSLLGHRSPTSTARYAHLTQASLRQGLDAIAAALEPEGERKLPAKRQPKQKRSEVEKRARP